MTDGTSRTKRGKPLPDEQVTDLSAYHSVAEAVAALLHPHAEVVVHDTLNDRIAGIWNAFSDRKVGDPSNLSNDPSLRTSDAIIGPYEKAERDGSRVKSVSAALRDSDGNRTGFLCINMDMSKFDSAIEMLRAFATTSGMMPEVLFKGDLREQVNRIVRDELIRLNKAISALSRDDRVGIVRRLDEAHIFQTRNAVPLVAAMLGLGRANIYYMLKQIRDQQPPTGK